MSNGTRDETHSRRYKKEITKQIKTKKMKLNINENIKNMNVIIK